MKSKLAEKIVFQFENIFFENHSFLRKKKKIYIGLYIHWMSENWGKGATDTDF